MQKVVVTGVNGFVGWHLANELIAQNYEVIGVGREETLNPNLQEKIKTYYACDLADYDSVASIPFAGVKAVINLAGLAAVDCGDGSLMLMADDTAFTRSEGGAFHCWNESAGDTLATRQIVDLTFRHNHTYAEKNGFHWTLAQPPAFLWGPQSDILLNATLTTLPASFPEYPAAGS